MSTNFEVKSFDGLNLVCRTWHVPQGESMKARILFLHGYSEFADAYNEWFPLVAEAGYEVTIYDQRGHGKTAVSKKDFGHSNEACVMGDIETMVNYVLENNNNPKVPFVLWGFSMGGANCLNYMVIGKKKEKVDLYISVAPYLQTHPQLNTGLNALKMKLLPYLARIYPRFTDNVYLTPEMANNNPEKWEVYHKQPLRHNRTSAEFMNDAILRGRRLLDPSFCKNVAERPLLLCHGNADQICDFSGSERFFKEVQLVDKTFDVYDGLPHELMQCVEKDKLEHWRRVKEWLDSHVEKLA